MDGSKNFLITQSKNAQKRPPNSSPNQSIRLLILTWKYGTMNSHKNWIFESAEIMLAENQDESDWKILCSTIGPKTKVSKTQDIWKWGSYEPQGLVLGPRATQISTDTHFL